MASKGKISIIVLLMILITGLLSGEIKATGKLLIPSACGEKPYNCIIVVKEALIEIECTKKIFQPFNQFDAPKQTKIVINTEEIKELQMLHQNRKIYLVTDDSFSIRYRNVFNRVSKIIAFDSLYPVNIENWALIFIVDNPEDIKTLGEELIKILGKRCDVRS
jgi:hypothetical protein